MHPDPHADSRIPKRLDPPEQIKGCNACHNSVQVVSERRPEHSEDSIAHFAVNDSAVLVHSKSHLLQSRRKSCD
jgi:hypothetical protein